MLLIPAIWFGIPRQSVQPQAVGAASGAASGDLVVLPAPENPTWVGYTGIAVWGNVPDSGVGGEVGYHWKLYRRDTPTPPDISEPADLNGDMRGNMGKERTHPTYETNIATDLWDNGFYFYAVSADGDGVQFANSPYVMSDAC